MTPFETLLRTKGIRIPDIATPIANYIPAKRVGNLVYTAGQVSAMDNLSFKGKLGREISVEDGREAARLSAMNCLAAVKSIIGSLDRVIQVVAVHGFVNSTAEFTGQADVMNAASDLMVDVFGEKGKHTRTAVGIASLPHDFTVSIYIIVEVE